jgi:uncharacterized protein YdaU (DUF1376 family)
VSNPFPYMPYWINDFANDPVVDAMSTLAVGAYHRLLWKAWNQKEPGTLPGNTALLRQWARVSDAEWVRIEPEILPAFRVAKSDGRWRQKRMIEVYRALVDRQKDTSNSARKAASVRWEKQRRLHTDALPMQCAANAKSKQSQIQIPSAAPQSPRALPAPAPPQDGGGGEVAEAVREIGVQLLQVVEEIAGIEGMTPDRVKRVYAKAQRKVTATKRGDPVSLAVAMLRSGDSGEHPAPTSNGPAEADFERARRIVARLPESEQQRLRAEVLDNWGTRARSEDLIVLRIARRVEMRNGSSTGPPLDPHGSSGGGG